MQTVNIIPLYLQICSLIRLTGDFPHGKWCPVLCRALVFNPSFGATLWNGKASCIKRNQMNVCACLCVAITCLFAVLQRHMYAILHQFLCLNILHKILG